MDCKARGDTIAKRTRLPASPFVRSTRLMVAECPPPRKHAGGTPERPRCPWPRRGLSAGRSDKIAVTPCSERSPYREEPPIRRAVLLTTGLALVVGLLAGLAGGLLATRVVTPSVPPLEVSVPAATDQRVRAAVDRVIPNVVLILADHGDERNIGSGVVVSPNGHVVTNSHVVRGATELAVVLANGDQRPARLLTDDWPFSDVAVITVPPQGLRPVALGSSSTLRPGDFVLPITGGTGGFGPGNAVALGVVSGVGRSLVRPGVILEDLIQTDANINSGDSGGALVNLQGEVVGLITSVVRSGPGGLELTGIGFAQSADSIRPVVASAISGTRYPRARIGIEVPTTQHVEITPELAAERRLPVQAGALVVAPATNSPAVRAGIETGDVVVGVNGVAIDLDTPFVNLLKALPAGARPTLAILRAGRPQTVTVTPEP